MLRTSYLVLRSSFLNRRTKNEVRETSPEGAFTLAEILVVVAIIAVAAVLMIPRYESFTEAGREDRMLRILSGGISRAQDIAVMKRSRVLLKINLDERRMSLADDLDGGAELPSAPLVVIAPVNGESIEAGVVEVAVDEYGNMPAWEFRIGDRHHVVVNPVTGILEPVEE